MMRSLWQQWSKAHQTPSTPSWSQLEKHRIEHIGSEYVMVEEPVGVLVPVMQKKWRLVHFDQSQHVLQYDNYRRVLPLVNISLVTPVEETAVDGTQRWWMTIQDPHAFQVWVLHFPSAERLLAWIELMQTVARTTNCSMMVHQLIRSDVTRPREIKPLESEDHELILDMTPACAVTA